MGAKAGQRGKASARGPVSRQRLGLPIFGVAFVLLFIGFAIAQGIGAPTVPAGDVAIVEGVPDDLGTITAEEFDRALEQQQAQREKSEESKQKKKPAKPGSPEYEELKEAAMSELLQAIWLRGQAEELGITVTDKQVETELTKIKKESFPKPAEYQKFLKESHFTQEEVDERLELQILSTRIQQRVSQEAPPPSQEQIADYYEAEKSAKFTTPASRDVRVVVSEEKSKIDAAKKALDSDNSPANWKKVVGKYSANPALKANGGLQPGITEETLQEPLKKAIFGAATNEVIGPVKYEANYFVLEVAKLNKANTKSLKEAESEITSTLGQEQQQEFFSEFVAGYQSLWRSRSFCASDFLVKECANYKGSGRLETANQACYEADPETAPTECPAPVTQTQPALPGTVTPLKPKGEPYVQRPYPAPEVGEEVEPGTEVAPPAESGEEGAAPPPASGGGSEGAGGGEGGGKGANKGAAEAESSGE